MAGLSGSSQSTRTSGLVPSNSSTTYVCQLRLILLSSRMILFAPSRTDIGPRFLCRSATFFTFLCILNVSYFDASLYNLTHFSFIQFCFAALISLFMDCSLLYSSRFPLSNRRLSIRSIISSVIHGFLNAYLGDFKCCSLVSRRACFTSFHCEFTSAGPTPFICLNFLFRSSAAFFFLSR